ncbi:MAG: UDP-N-acetylmuramoyl-L-alanine--D-glutamate ligase [archaeon]|nr:UDP-N-acetylmuramoyl-L-alanine--D-glutamate ligase [archaeon]
MNKIEEIFNNKKILILGYGAEGKSTHKYIVENNINCEIYISDQRDISNELVDNNVKVVEVDKFLKDLESYDIIMQSPGVSMKDINITNIKDKIYSQTELFIEMYADKIIGVTGTKGKSTTTSLIYQLMKDQNKDVILVGNIGIPFFDEIKNIKEDTIIVAEYSCHQLEFIKKSPHVGIIVNIYEEHLDHYQSFQQYKQTKCNIIKYQQANDYALVNIDNKNIKEYLEKKEVVSNIIELSGETNSLFHMKQDSIFYNNEEIFSKDDPRNLLGKHNLYNIMTLFAVANIYNISINDVKETVKNFAGLEHRMEFVRELDGVKYYNDSISTIPETCIAALETFPETDTLIVGGNDRGINYNKLIEKINLLPNLKVICIDDVGMKIYNEINNEKYQINDMHDVVIKAKEITKKLCLLSPAASSYGHYKNFKERGTMYKNEVMKLK